jgi:hypothetical protein
MWVHVPEPSRSRPSAAPGGGARTNAGRVLALQRAAGNRAVAGVLARQAVTWPTDTKLAPGESERMYDQAVRSQDWQLLLAVVSSFAADTDAVRLLRPIQQHGAVPFAMMLAQHVFQWDADHPLRRALAFLRVEGQTGRQARGPERNAGWNLGAADGSPESVPGGSVTVYTEVEDPRGGRSDHFALQYKGLDADTTGWLQFVAVEAEAFDAATGGEGHFQSGTMTGSGQPETLAYGSRDSIDWHLDTRSGTLPFYESADPSGKGAGTAIIEYPRTPTAPGQTTMIDRPQQDPAIVKKAWGRSVRRVERRVRCHQYLVRGEDVLFENELVVQDTYWNTSEPPVRRNLPGRRGPTDRLQAAHHQALIGRRPEFGYFAH